MPVEGKSPFFIQDVFFGSESDFPDFIREVSPVYLSAELIGMKVIPEVFRKMRHKPEPINYLNV